MPMNSSVTEYFAYTETLNFELMIFELGDLVYLFLGKALNDGDYEII